MPWAKKNSGKQFWILKAFPLGVSISQMSIGIFETAYSDFAILDVQELGAGEVVVWKEARQLYSILNIAAY